MSEDKLRIMQLEDDKRWLQSQIDALEAENEKLRKELKKAQSAYSDAAYAMDRNDYGRDGWN